VYSAQPVVGFFIFF